MYHASLLPVPYRGHLSITLHSIESDVEVDSTLISTVIFTLIWRLLPSLGFHANLLKSVYEELVFINGNHPCVCVEIASK
jgi:hypothetical protein